MTRFRSIITGCTICRDPALNSKINAYLKAGIAVKEISRMLDPDGARTQNPEYRSPPTIYKHKLQHLTSEKQRDQAKAVAEARKQQRTLVPISPRAYLEAIVAKANESVADGTATVTVKDGIAAATSLENIASKGADREVALQIIGALSGAWHPVEIEGEYRELTADQLVMQDELKQLTAG